MPLIGIIYSGRYAEAAVLLQVFSVLALLTPAIAVASNVLLGLGQARAGFIIGIQSLISAVVLYFVLVPWLGVLGATIGYVLSTALLLWLTVSAMNRFVPVTIAGVVRRTHDIKMFVLSRTRRRHSADTTSRP